MSDRYNAPDLVTCAAALLSRAGLDEDKAQIVATILVEGDLLGHTTHGLALLAPYLDELTHGRMTKTGEPRTIADLPAAITWDGRRLPGPWLVRRALDLAMSRAAQHGTCTVAIRRSHHIACLAAYLTRATDRGLMAMITCSDPTVGGVAPHGGRDGVMTPNPIAAAWPTDGDPVIIDLSMSITTHGLTRRLANEGRTFPGEWALDAEGHPSDDPAVMYADPPGALLPMGGVDHGHKGYALGLFVEALTGALAGHGRADPPEGWSASVLVQVFDPRLFGGQEDFLRQTSHVAAACRATRPRPGGEPVRLPGASGLRRRDAQLATGVELYPGILAALTPWARQFGVTIPTR